MFSSLRMSFAMLNSSERKRFVALVIGRVVAQSLDLIGLAGVAVLASFSASYLGGREVSLPLIGEPADIGLAVMIGVTVVTLFFVVKSAISSFLLRYTTKFLATVEARVASEIADYLLDSDLVRLRSMSRGTHQWLLSESIHVAVSRLLFSGSALVTESSLFFMVFLVFAFIDPQSAVIMGGYFGGIVAVFQISVNRRLARLGQRISETAVDLNQSILDLHSVFREATVLSTRSTLLEKIKRIRMKYADDLMLHRFVMGLPRFFIESAMMVGVLALVLWQAYRGDINSALVTLSIFLVGGVRLLAALLPLQNAVTEIRTFSPQGKLAQESWSQITEEKLLPKSESSGHPLNKVGSSAPLIEFQCVNFSYPEGGFRSVADFSMEIHEGTFLAVVGPSGSGKTTLADLLLGVLRPDSGSILIKGKGLEEFRELYPGFFGYVPQQPGMVRGTVAENVALGIGKSEIDLDQVEQSLRKAELWKTVSNLPGALDTPLGEGQMQLSGGELQRLGLARALYRSPKILVLDEATSALDSETEASLVSTLQDLRGEVTQVVIAHRLSTIKNADELVLIEKGKIRAKGSFQEITRAIPNVESFLSAEVSQGRTRHGQD